MDLRYSFQDLLAVIKRSLHTQLIHIALFLLLLLVLFSSQKKRISSHHILAFNQQKNNLERKHFTNWTHTLFIVSEIVLHKASPFLKPFPILYKNILMQVINLSLNIQLF